jgi:hypothetical protein
MLAVVEVLMQLLAGPVEQEERAEAEQEQVDQELEHQEQIILAVVEVEWVKILEMADLVVQA